VLKQKKMGARILFPIVTVTVILSVAFYFVGDATVKIMADSALGNQISAKIADIGTSEKRIAREMLTEAALFSRATAVQEAYLTAYKGNINEEHDPSAELARAQLRAYFASIEKGYRENLQAGNFRIHFHLPPARSLLRLWKPKQNRSDDLRSFRNTILAISRGRHEPVQGIEIGRGGFAIRGIAPVLGKDNRYLGSVEVLSSYAPLVRYSISNKNESIAVYMNKEFLPIATRLQNAKQHPVIGDQFVFVSSTDKKATDPLLSAELLVQGREGVFKTRNGTHLITVFPIKDFSGKQIGVMAYMYNAADLYGTIDKIRWAVAAFALILLLSISGSLVMTLRGVTHPLNRIIESLDKGAAQVTTASGQIFSASHSLAEGASEQASSIEEASSSLVEISSMTKRNAENAGLANKLMKGADQVVGNANASMTELTTSMVEISRASEKTQHIVKTIDEIAFQTNLLALNAAVEAARAGEAGAGFAVVADEVRNLAMRAAEAAKDTADLIEGTVKKVKDGGDIVARTNEDFSVVAKSAAKVARLIGEIAAASNEQTEGIDQVATAVTEMDRVVQQNAANAEESASASREMNAQAEQLKTMVTELVALVHGAGDQKNGPQRSADHLTEKMPHHGRSTTSEGNDDTRVLLTRNLKGESLEGTPAVDDDFCDF